MKEAIHVSSIECLSPEMKFRFTKKSVMFGPRPRVARRRGVVVGAVVASSVARNRVGEELKRFFIPALTLSSQGRQTDECATSSCRAASR